MSYTFDVIIPTYNNLHELKACLTGFSEQQFKDFRIIICVDGSNDGTREFLETYTPDFDFLVLEHSDKNNRGGNAARNLAVSKLDSKYVVLLDSDLVPGSKFLEAHLKQMEKSGGISVGDIIWTNAEKNIWAGYQMTRGKNRFKDCEVIPYKYYSIANSAMATNKLVQISGFDTEIKHYGGDDNDLGFRLFKEFDPKIVFNQKAVVTGEMNKDIRQALFQLSEFGAFVLPYLIKKHADFPDIFNIEFIGKKTLFSSLIFNNIVAKILRLIRPFSPKKLKFIEVHYLTALFIRRGYLKRKSEVKENIIY